MGCERCKRKGSKCEVCRAKKTRKNGGQRKTRKQTRRQHGG